MPIGNEAASFKVLGASTTGGGGGGFGVVELFESFLHEMHVKNIVTIEKTKCRAFICYRMLFCKTGKLEPDINRKDDLDHPS
jgi:hypothetical protein